VWVERERTRFKIALQPWETVEESTGDSGRHLGGVSTADDQATDHDSNVVDCRDVGGGRRSRRSVSNNAVVRSTGGSGGRGGRGSRGGLLLFGLGRLRLGSFLRSFLGRSPSLFRRGPSLLGGSPGRRGLGRRGRRRRGGPGLLGRLPGRRGLGGRRRRRRRWRGASIGKAPRAIDDTLVKGVKVPEQLGGEVEAVRRASRAGISNGRGGRLATILEDDLLEAVPLLVVFGHVHGNNPLAVLNVTPASTSVTGLGVVEGPLGVGTALVEVLHVARKAAGKTAVVTVAVDSSLCASDGERNSSEESRNLHVEEAKEGLGIVK
jgi:hypothetical protein